MEPVAILDHPSGLELNLVLNAPRANEPNILMDVAEKSRRRSDSSPTLGSR